MVNHSRRNENANRSRKVAESQDSRRELAGEPKLERHLEEAIELATD